MSNYWNVQLFGDLQVSRKGHETARFQTRKTGAILAYLALRLNQRAVRREELVANIWPEADIITGLTRLRQSLSALRVMLERPEYPSGSAIISDRISVRLNPLTGSTDVIEFEQLIEQVKSTIDLKDRIEVLRSATDLVKGELLPGIYEEWAVQERNRLAEVYRSSLRELSSCYESSGNLDKAIEYIAKAVKCDSLDEDNQLSLMRLYGLKGNSSAAFRQYKQYEKELYRQLGENPSREAQNLIAKIRREQLTVPEKILVRSGREKLAPEFSVPVTLTKFFGREQELDRIEEILGASKRRLITITGMGGSGKTRLAIEVGKRFSERDEYAVGFVPLADIADADSMPAVILKELKIPVQPSVNPLKQLSELFSDMDRVLLILDNMEQLSGGGTQFICDLLKQTPNLYCILTSRHRLSLDVEQEIPLLPLPMPDQSTMYNDLLSFSGAQLLLDRMQAVNVNFELLEKNYEDVLVLMQRLEGLPLAIELVASWAQMLTPVEMVKRMEEPIYFLVNRRKQSEPRHHSLALVIDQSFDLLPSHLQSFMSKLSYFHKGWTLEAAEFVCDEPKSLEYLESLLERSLIYVEKPSGAQDSMVRYRMLDLVRDYIAPKLSGQDYVTLGKRHAEFYTTYVVNIIEKPDDADHTHWIAKIEREYDNLLRTLHWCLEERSIELGLHLTSKLTVFWEMSYRVEAARKWFDLLLSAAEDISPQSRAEALNSVGRLAWLARDLDAAEEALNQSSCLSREMGLSANLIQVLHNLGLVAMSREKLAHLLPLAEEGVRLSQETSDEAGLALSLFALGCYYEKTTEFERSKKCYHECLALELKLGNKERIIRVSMSLASIAMSLEQYELAISYIEQCLEQCIEESPHNVFLEDFLYIMLACNCVYLHRYEKAHAYLCRCLRSFVMSSRSNTIGSMLAVDTFHLLVEVSAAFGLHDRAVTLLAGSVRFHNNEYKEEMIETRHEYEELYAEVKENVSEVEFDEAWAKGLIMPTHALVTYALEDIIPEKQARKDA